MDYSKLTDEEFQAHCTALYAEQERRAKIASIPTEIKNLANSFEQLGGDKADLVSKINEAPAEETA